MKASRHAMLFTLLLLPLSPAVFANTIIDTKAEAASIAAVDGASINILSPSDSARLDAYEEYPLAFEVALGKGGDHFHVWVDDKRGPGIHEKKGTYALPKLTPGEHVISIQVVDKSHVGTGPKKSIRVIADPNTDPES